MHFFFFNDTATTEIYTLSLHDALPIFFTGSATARAHRVAGRHGGIRARVRRTDTAFDCAGGSNHAAAVDRVGGACPRKQGCGRLPELGIRPGVWALRRTRLGFSFRTGRELAAADSEKKIGRAHV